MEPKEQHPQNGNHVENGKQNGRPHRVQGEIPLKSVRMLQTILFHTSVIDLPNYKLLFEDCLRAYKDHQYPPINHVGPWKAAFESYRRFLDECSDEEIFKILSLVLNQRPSYCDAMIAGLAQRGTIDYSTLFRVQEQFSITEVFQSDQSRNCHRLTVNQASNYRRPLVAPPRIECLGSAELLKENGIFEVTPELLEIAEADFLRSLSMITFKEPPSKYSVELQKFATHFISYISHQVEKDKITPYGEFLIDDLMSCLYSKVDNIKLRAFSSLVGVERGDSMHRLCRFFFYSATIPELSQIITNVGNISPLFKNTLPKFLRSEDRFYYDDAQFLPCVVGTPLKFKVDNECNPFNKEYQTALRTCPALREINKDTFYCEPDTDIYKDIDDNTDMLIKLIQSDSTFSPLTLRQISDWSIFKPAWHEVIKNDEVEKLFVGRYSSQTWIEEPVRNNQGIYEFIGEKIRDYSANFFE